MLRLDAKKTTGRAASGVALALFLSAARSVASDQCGLTPPLDDVVWYEIWNQKSLSLARTNGGGFDYAGKALSGLERPDWAGVGDFTGDLRDDIAWYEFADGVGKITVAQSTGTSLHAARWLTGFGRPDWAGVGDFDGDRKDDVAWYEFGNYEGRITVARSTGGSLVWGGVWLTGFGRPDWAGVGDFDGDGRGDLAWYEFADGEGRITVARSTGGAFEWGGVWLTGFGRPDWAGVGDFDGDGKDDLAWYEFADGEGRITVARSTGGALEWAGKWLTGFGRPDWAGVGDFGGDGKDDLAWYEFADGEGRITVARSTGGAFEWAGKWLTGFGRPDWAGVGNLDGDHAPCPADPPPGPGHCGNAGQGVCIRQVGCHWELFGQCLIPALQAHCNTDRLNNIFGICTPCGREGWPLCASGAPCDPGSTLIAGVCIPLPCGGAGQVTCVSGPLCNTDRLNPIPPVPSLGVCTPCGRDSQPFCFSGQACDQGFSLVAGLCLPVSCGGAWEVACAGPGGMCRSDRLNPIPPAPGLGVCTPCGGGGEPVCSSDPPCDSGLVRIGDACFPVPCADQDAFDCLGCGDDRQRACTIPERLLTGSACRPGQGLAEFLCGLDPDAPGGVCGVGGSISWCERGVEGFGRGSVPARIVTTAGAEVDDLALGMTLGVTRSEPDLDGGAPTVDWGDSTQGELDVPGASLVGGELPKCFRCGLSGRHTYATAGDYEIRISYQERGGLGQLEGRREAVIPVRVEPVTEGEFVMASIGDSVASGEGVPDRVQHFALVRPPVPVTGLSDPSLEPVVNGTFARIGFSPHVTKPATWGDGRGPTALLEADTSPCHRSRWAGPVQAATRIQRENPNTLVRMFHEACSGAQLGSEIPEQAARLGGALEGRRLDALLVSGGANDVGFSSFTKLCLNPGASVGREPGRCDTPETLNLIDAGLAPLADRYAALGATIAEDLADLGQVYVTEYFDPTGDETGGFPDGESAKYACTFGLMHQEEWRFLHDRFMTPLNASVKANAEGLGWRFVGGIAEAFRTHGMCAGDQHVPTFTSLLGLGDIVGAFRSDSGKSWVVAPIESIFGQGDADGTAHPNREGHAAYADALVRAIYEPVTEAVIEPAGWTNQDAVVTVLARSSHDTLPAARVASTYYAVDDVACSPSNLDACAAYSEPVHIAAEGRHRVTAFSRSVGGVFGPITTAEAAIDRTPPVIVGSRSPAPNGAGWNNGEVTVSFACSDPLSGVAACDDATVLASEGADQSVAGAAVDEAGNTASATVGGIHIDRTPPTILGRQVPAANASGWHNTDVNVHFKCWDELSGIETCGPNPQLVSGEGVLQARMGIGVDRAGNSTRAIVRGISIDRTPPSTTAAISPAPNGHGWNDTDVSVTLTGVDALSGVAEIQWSIDGAEWVSYAGPVPVSAEGIHTLLFRSRDRADNQESSQSLTLRIDRTPPEAFAQFGPPTRDVAVLGRDSLSGVASVTLASVLPAPRLDTSDRVEGGVASGGRGRGRAELRTYEVKDLSGNVLTLALSVQREDRALRGRVTRIQYAAETASTLPRNGFRFEWSEASGALTWLEQDVEVQQRRDRQEVEARFEATRNQTLIEVKGPGRDRKLVKPGLALLGLATDRGKLLVEY